MELRKTIFLLAAALLFVSTVSSQSVQVEGLTSEKVDATFHDTARGSPGNITFNTSYMTQNVSYRDVFLPDVFQSRGLCSQCEFKKDTVQRSNVNDTVRMRSVIRLNRESWGDYEYPGDAENAIGGSWYYEDQADSPTTLRTRSSVGEVFDGNFSNGASLNVDVSAHYEHLLIDYTVRYENGSVAWKGRDVYSGNDTERLPVAGSVDQINTTHVTQSATYDNLYGDRENKTLIIAHEPETNISGVDWKGLEHSKCSGDYSSVVQPELEAQNISEDFWIDESSEYKYTCFNVTYPADSAKTVDINFTQPEDSSVEEQSAEFSYDGGYSYYSYLIGSVATFKYDYNNQPQTFSPEGSGGVYRIEIFGAKGQNSDLYSGGKGGFLNGTLALYPEDELDIYLAESTGSGYYQGGDAGGGSSGSGAGSTEVLFGTNGSLVGAADGGGGAGSSSDGYTYGGGGGAAGGLGGSGYFGGDDAEGTGNGGDGGSDSPGSPGGYRTGLLEDTTGQEGYSSLVESEVKITLIESFNQPPSVPSLDSPSNESSGLDNTVSLEASVSDPDGDDLSVSFHWGNGTEIATNTGVSNGSSTITSVSGLDWGTEYSWYVVADDGSASTESGTSSFTTQYSPLISNTTFVDDRGQGLTEIQFGLDSQGESDISGYSGLYSSKLFSNTTLKSGIGLPFSSTVSISDSFGASSDVDVDLYESDSGLREHNYSHSIDVQRVNQSVTVFNNESSSIGYELVLDLPGTLVQGQSWNGSIPGTGNVTHTAVSEGDWIVNESESTTEISQDTSIKAGVDQQTLYNQSQLEVVNTRGFTFNDVDVSSKCATTSTVNVSSGESVVTEACNNNSFSGDWIRNEENTSTKYVDGDVLLGKDATKSFQAQQSVEVTNVRSNTDLTVDLDSLIEDVSGCQLGNSSTQDVPADSVSSFTFTQSCSPGSHLNRTPVVKTETDSFYKYSIEFGFDVASNLTEEQDFEYAVKTDWADNWNSRDPTETEAFIDGSSKDIQVEERVIDGTEYIVFVIGDEHGNSSVHEGSHTASLNYYESKSPGSTSGSSGGSGGGLLDGGSETVVEEVSSDKYNWTFSTITSNGDQSFQISGYPGASFEKYVVLRNTGDSNVTLDVECVSVGEACSWVDLDVDRVVLNRNSFSEKTVTVTGEVPEGFSEDAPIQFSIRASDPRFNESSSGDEGVAYVDFTVTNSPVLGPALA